MSLVVAHEPATEPKTVTPADLLERSDRNRFELVDGTLVERNVSQLSSLVALELGSRLRNHLRPLNLAWVFGADAGYRCFPDDPNKVRKPDVSVVLKARLPLDQMREGYAPIAPDLAVEVISPHDLVYDVDAKIAEYQGAGVRLVWVVNPILRTVRIHRADGSLSWLQGDAILSGEDVLPGFSCPVSELFPVATPATA